MSMRCLPSDLNHLTPSLWDVGIRMNCSRFMFEKRFLQIGSICFLFSCAEEPRGCGCVIVINGDAGIRRLDIDG